MTTDKITREEAIAKIRKMSLPEETMKLLIALAPELTESEDERIRKGIIAHIQGHLDTQDDFTRRQATGPFSSEEVKFFMNALAWLEKQKERGPLTKEEEYTLQRIIERLEDEGCPSDWISLLHDIYCLPYEKLKEQKPAEWNEEDKEMIERLIRHTQEEFNELCNDRYGHQEIISDLKESCRERMNWLENRLKSLRPHWKPSEEQMRALRNFSTGLFVGDGDCDALRSLCEDLEKQI